MSKIEWTNKTWNPIRGCSIVSKGCTNCYAMKQAHRFSGPGKAYEGLTKLTSGGPVWTGNIKLVPEKLDEPLKWKKPARVFVNSMSDLFHEDVPDDFIYDVMNQIYDNPQHTFQVLTKRIDRAFEFFAGRSGAGLNYDPIKNLWLGVSVEDQEKANERIPILLQIPAGIHWISAEPILGDLDLTSLDTMAFRGAEKFDALTGDLFDMFGEPVGKIDRKLNWVVVGGESGPGARDCCVSWFLNILHDCTGARIPLFVKQLGKHPYNTNDEEDNDGWPVDHYLKLADRKGGDFNDPNFPDALKIREYPQ